MKHPVGQNCNSLCVWLRRGYLYEKVFPRQGEMQLNSNVKFSASKTADTIKAGDLSLRERHLWGGAREDFFQGVPFCYCFCVGGLKRQRSCWNVLQTQSAPFWWVATERKLHLVEWRLQETKCAVPGLIVNVHHEHDRLSECVPSVHKLWKESWITHAVFSSTSGLVENKGAYQHQSRACSLSHRK